jgi:PKD repeat protein
MAAFVCSVYSECVPNKPPVAAFAYLPLKPHVFESILFNASASYDPDDFIASYTWGFDDGNVTKVFDAIISHYYGMSGSYNVTLTVEDSGGLKNSTSREVTVTAPPFASFSYSPTHLRVGEAATFNASQSKPNGGYIVSYEWDFGDGNVSTIANPITIHVYSALGVYTVSLTVADSENESDVASDIIRVWSYLHANFTFEPLSPRVDENVKFDASASTSNGGYIVSYEWDFGDGNITTIADPIMSHIYFTFGVYTVTLTVTDSENESDIASDTIRVWAYPHADFTFEPQVPHITENVKFDASASTPNGGDIVSYEWDFGDDTNASGMIVTHHYAKAGNYTVTLNVTDSEEKWDVELKNVEVLPQRDDLNEDGKVDILDLAVLCKAYGSYPGHPRWNSKADIIPDLIINILDVVKIAKAFHQ